MKLRLAEESDENGIQLTPLIDVVFQLLVFFMVVTTFLEPEKELGVELPAAQAGLDPARERQELVINVLRDGRVVLAGREVDDPSLALELARLARLDARASVTIRGDRLVHHQEIVRVMDACRTAGLSNLALGTLAQGI